MARMAVKHTITIRANITAYSTAVGPSSETRNFFTFAAKRFMASLRWSTAVRHAPQSKFRSRAMPTLATELVGDVVERSRCIRANRANGREAHDHDQRQHNGVFNRGRTIFRDEETLHLQSELLHDILRFSNAAPAGARALLVGGGLQ